VVAGYPSPRPTVYRASTLLIPDDLLRDEGFLQTIKAILAEVGMDLAEPARDRDPDGSSDFRELPRPAVLVPVEGYATGVVVDAWVALCGDQQRNPGSYPCGGSARESARRQDASGDRGSLG
jgi:hypothetical protein